MRLGHWDTRLSNLGPVKSNDIRSLLWLELPSTLLIHVETRIDAKHLYRLYPGDSCTLQDYRDKMKQRTEQWGQCRCQPWSAVFWHCYVHTDFSDIFWHFCCHLVVLWCFAFFLNVVGQLFLELMSLILVCLVSRLSWTPWSWWLEFQNLILVQSWQVAMFTRDLWQCHTRTRSWTRLVHPSAANYIFPAAKPSSLQSYLWGSGHLVTVIHFLCIV